MIGLTPEERERLIKRGIIQLPVFTPSIDPALAKKRAYQRKAMRKKRAVERERYRLRNLMDVRNHRARQAEQAA